MGFFTEDKLKTIRIACQGAATAELNELNELQGDLKTQTDEGYEWQKHSILELGFSFPMSIWIDPEGTKWEIDGHRRLRTLRKMRDEEGFLIPPIPVSYVYADNKTQAKKKILANISQPEEVTEEGFHDFITEEGSEIQEAEAEEFYTAGFEDDEELENTADTEQEDEKPKKASCEACKTYHERNHQG